MPRAIPLPVPTRRRLLASLVGLGALSAAGITVVAGTAGATSEPPRSAAGAFLAEDGVALAGHDAVAYFTLGRPVKGRPELRVEYLGAVFLFATEAHRAAFAADPARYAPQYGGYCAFGAAQGYKAVIDPRAFSVVEGKLYLNYSASVQRQWARDPAGFIRQANEKWPSVQTQTNVLR